MKLISKTMVYYLLISLPLLLIAGFISYHVIKREVKEGTDESLWIEKANVQKLIRSFTSPHDTLLTADSLSKITVSVARQQRRRFLDTSLYDPMEKEVINYRMLQAYAEEKGTTYCIQLAKPIVEEEELMEGLVTSMLMIFGFLMLAFFALNWILSNWLWKPFYSTIEALSQYDVKQHQALQLPRSGTKEFNRLNGAVNAMTDKIRRDFLQQREFTENASHEMQTPLAVIKTRLELLIQSKNLGEKEMDQLTAIEYAVNKMSALHKALLLLAKIENNQFKDLADVDLKKIIEKALMNYEDQLVSKSIVVKATLQSSQSVKMNPVLADILVSNLVQNAIRHNVKGGAIEIDLNDNSLLVSNTGEPLQVPAEELFIRFKKNDASRESLGLGLAIVKSIAELYNIDLNYEWKQDRHLFRLKFPDR